MKLGLLGFSGNSVKSRTDTLGVYRPESNRHIQIYNGKTRFYQFWGQKQVINSSTLKSITGLTFKPDGTQVYILADGDNSIYQYNLPTPWDITSISSITPTSSAELSNYLYSRTGAIYTLTQTTGVAFSSDGSLMTIVDNNDRKIVQFTLSTPWTVSSRTFTNTTTDNDRTLWYLPSCNSVRDVSFSNDGSKLFALVTNTSDVMSISQFTLNSGATAFNIGTKGSPNYTILNLLNISNLDTTMRGMCFNNSGSKLYLCGLTKAQIYGLDLTSPFLWDESNPVNYDNGSFLYDGLIAGREGTPEAVFINTESNNMDLYVVGADNRLGVSRYNIIYQYKLIQK
jgi:hypothetical protein